MKSWYERSREYHVQHRGSADGVSTSHYSGTRSTSPDEFHSPHQSTLAPSVSSYSDHYRRRATIRPARGDPEPSAAAARTVRAPMPSQPVAAPTVSVPAHEPDTSRTRTGSRRRPASRTSPLSDDTASEQQAASSPRSVTTPDELASQAHSDLEWGRGVHAAAQMARVYALWETERASLVHSRDTLEASLQRERCMRGELEDQLRGLRLENQSLKDTLASTIGSPLARRSSSAGRRADASAGGADLSDATSAQRQRHLLELVQAYDGMLRDLQQLQTSPRAAQAFSQYPITRHDLTTLVPASPVSSSPSRSSESAAVQLPTHPSPPPAACASRLELEPSGSPACVVLEDTPVKASVDTSSAEQSETALLSPPPLERPAAPQGSERPPSPPSPPSLPLARPPVTLSLSPPPPYMRSATRSPPQDRLAPSRPTAQPSPWRGPMHSFRPEGGAAEGHGAVARPLYRTPPTAVEREAAILETDTLTRAVAAELTRLAEEHDARDAPAVAALCAERGLDYVDAAFPPVTASLGPGGCRVFVPSTGREHTVQFQHVDTLVPPGRRAALISSAGLDPCAVQVGPLNDRGVAAGLAALAEASGAVASILASTTAEDEVNGLTRVWVCAAGVWTLVDVDAHLPVLQDDAGHTAPAMPPLYGCANRLTFDLWPAVCEKALAKVLGSYRATAGLEASATLGLFTGGPVELWDWWRGRLDVAFDEIEAAINTTVRGSGVVLLTTHSTLSARALSRAAATSHAAAGESDLTQAMRASGLSPATSYRVLAATQDERGQRMLLLRLWEAASESATTTSTPRHRRLSPLRAEPLNASDGHLREVGAAARGDDGACAWLPLHGEVAALFEHCHVCFDCRRFHDVRVPVPFSGNDPCSPRCVLRIDVRRPRDHTGDAPARVWIGLHQPLLPEAGALGGIATSSLTYCGLKMALLVPDLEDNQNGGPAQRRQSLSAALCAPATYSVSESFGGHFQTRPSVWMYVELETFAASTTTFYVIPQLDVTESTLARGPMTNGAAAVSAARSAVLAVLAEDKALLDVQLLQAPSELPAALCHGGLDCLDMTTCAPYAAHATPDEYQTDDDRLEAQINGRWVRHFTW